MGIFKTILEKYKKTKQGSLNIKEFKNNLLLAVKDGKLTHDEIAELDKRKTELALTSKDIKKIRVDVYLAAFNANKTNSRITREEEKDLEEIQEYLGLADFEIEKSKRELAHLRLLNEIQRGNIPVIQISGIAMQKNEKVYWSEPGRLIEEKVVGKHYEGGSRGVSVRIMKGVSLRAGSFRGQLVSDTRTVAASEGDLVITSRRIIFRGNNKSFATILDKILDQTYYNNGLKFSENNKQKPRTILFNEDQNGEIVRAILAYAINHYDDQ